MILRYVCFNTQVTQSEVVFSAEPFVCLNTPQFTNPFHSGWTLGLLLLYGYSRWGPRDISGYFSRMKTELLSHGCVHSCCFHSNQKEMRCPFVQVRPTLIINPFESFLLLDEGWKVSPTTAFICMVMITSRLNIFQMFFWPFEFLLLWFVFSYL